MATEEKWYFTKEQLDNSPSKQSGIDAHNELFFRQQAANFIQEMGQRLRVSQLCINTATVYMHRFYVFHSFTHFPWQSIAAAALFLSAKVEEQPRKMEHVIRVHNVCRNPRDLAFDINSEKYQTQSQDLVFNENILLQTLGFDVAIDHPHAHVVRCCHLVRASKDLAQTSYFMASASLRLTTMCLQYKPTVVACFCIHLACKWSNWEIPLSNERKEWFYYVDPTVTSELLQQLTEEFLEIHERCPSKLKEKLMMSRTTGHMLSPFESDSRKMHPQGESKDPHHRPHHHDKSGMDEHKHRSSRPHESTSSSSSGSSQQQRDRERERKERERIAQHSSGSSSNPGSSVKPPLVPTSGSSSKPPGGGPAGHHHHHRPSGDSKSSKPHPRVNHREWPPPSSVDGSAKDALQMNRDSQVRSDKELEKRVSAKPTTDTNNGSGSSGGSSSTIEYGSFSGEKRLDPPPSRSRPGMPPDPKALVRNNRHENNLEHTIKQENGWYDNKNALMKQMTNSTSTSQKLKSPFTPDASSKSVPKTTSKIEIKLEPNAESSANGNAIYDLPMLPFEIKQEVKEELPVKKPSMFSPEKTPPKKVQPIAASAKRSLESLTNIPLQLSPIPSGNRSRTVSNSSEPELRPVMKKLDEIEGFENILQTSTIGIKKEKNPVPEVTKQQQEAQLSSQLKEHKLAEAAVGLIVAGNTSLSQPIVNGIETNPTLISNLLKEAPPVPHLPTISTALVQESALPVNKDKEHHKDRKKKSKEKHKHKDKHRDDKEKKRKHKDKDRHKGKSKDKEKTEEPPATQPIKITISKDKIQPPDAASSQSGGLKIKIPKDRLKKEVIGNTAAPTAPAAPVLKIKISKDVITNLGNDSSSSNKKRERERDRSSSANEMPPSKIAKTSSSSSSGAGASHKQQQQQQQHHQNGRTSSYNKVAHMGDGDTSMHKLADSKYINKGASA